jgi:hypothetical protein
LTFFFYKKRNHRTVWTGRFTGFFRFRIGSTGFYQFACRPVFKPNRTGYITDSRSDRTARQPWFLVVSPSLCLSSLFYRLRMQILSRAWRGRSGYIHTIENLHFNFLNFQSNGWGFTEEQSDRRESFLIYDYYYHLFPFLFKIILKKNRKLQKMWRKIKQKSSMIPIASQILNLGLKQSNLLKAKKLNFHL